jgi:hypothetical protein
MINENLPGIPQVRKTWILKTKTLILWRRGWESNPRIKVLQTLALPLGYRAAQVGLPKNTASTSTKSITLANSQRFRNQGRGAWQSPG